MAVQWTTEQQQVIELRDANILVSAAAGSGKTAVLVQRIIEKIMDEEHPVNIDQLVIVTFTQAAAGEMRERIQAAIEKQAAIYPDNEHLQRQKTRIHMANISTIHSFCKNVIQNHFQEIDLEPSFRVGDEGELKLMKKDVLSQVLEEYYEEGSQEFYRFSETFSTGKSDERIEEIILDLYHFSMSYPYPVKWIDSCVEYYKTQDYEELMKTEWMQALFRHLQQMSAYLQSKLNRIDEILEELPENDAYQEIFEYYRLKIKKLNALPDYRNWYEVLCEIKHPALPRGKKSCQDVAVREEIKLIRDDIKDVFDKICESYFQQSEEQLLEDLANCCPVIETLAKVTRRFMEAFKEEKRQKNILDFNDLEHEALHILLDEDGNPTETAREYAEFFDEILIDEYQDSNLVQEYLLTSVSKCSMGINNIFMVGDAKQSIYRFRLARPELFMEKFNTYSTEEGICRRIDLHKNFRSRREVLDSANYIFERIMKPSLGGIDYDSAAALYPGMEFEAAKEEGAYTTEVLLFDKSDKEMEISPIQYEAKMIAHRIRQLVSDTQGIQVFDKQTGTYRKARYSDIAILLRSTKGFDTILTEEMVAEGIPSHMLSKEGYFDTLEIATILNLLRIIDNPLQDIPFLSVLKSPLAGLDDEDLTRIRIDNREVAIYQCAVDYAQNGRDELLRGKLSEFLEQLTQFRKKMNYVPIHKFLCHVLEVTGYGDYIAVMPGGEQRKANVEMLIEKAAAFEETSYLGVFQFIRYIEQLQKYEIDMGEASIIGENDNTVRIMTIHKSKGLEFPIVFVAGMGRRFNRMESRQPLVMHPQLGIGIENVLLETRQKNKMLLRNTILLQNQLETMGEELRVLYVALTRAREKLILTGGIENLENHMKKAYSEGFKQELSYGYLSTVSCYMDWILAAIVSHKDMYEELEKYIENPGYSQVKSAFSQAEFSVREISLEDLMLEDLKELAREERNFLELELNKSTSFVELPKEIKEALEFEYAYEEENKVPAKVSVSELKHAGMVLEEEEKQLIEELEQEPVVPNFIIQKEEEVLATDRGTAYHKVFECLDLSCAENLSQVEEQLDKLFESGMLEEKMRTVIKPYKLLAFAKSPIGRRMQKAQEEGKLYKEQPFVYAMPANQLDLGWNSQEAVMIQGIIDVFFEEDGELVILDYKTDYVKLGEEDKLVDKYKTQMEYYKRALQEIRGTRVKEIVLYSVFLEKSIAI